MDWEASSPTYTFNELRNQLCGDAKIKFDANKVSLFGLCNTCGESKKDWITRTIELKDVDYYKHPTNLEELLAVDDASHDVFNFQRSMSIEAINRETIALDRKAHLFWEIPTIDARVCSFMDTISDSGDVRRKLAMIADTNLKDAKTFYTVKKTRI